MCTTTTCRPRTNPVGIRAYTTQFIPLLIEWDVREYYLNEKDKGNFLIDVNH